MKRTFFEDLPARKNPPYQPGSPNSPAQGPKGGSDDEASAKRVRQAVYDIRYRAKQDEVELEVAFNSYIGNASMTPVEKKSVREKLFGESFDMTEDEDRKYSVRVHDKAAGKTYYRKADRKTITKLRGTKNISSVEMSTYKTPADDEGDDNSKKGKEKVTTQKEANDGNLANNYPPYDKVTRGDVIAGATGKDEMGGKNKKKKKTAKEEWESILSDPMLRVVSDEELEATIYDVFEEIEQEGFLTETLEFIDSDQFLAEERDAGAIAKGRLERKRMGATADGPQSGGAAKRFVAKKAKQAVKVGADRVGSAVKKVGSAVKKAGSVAAAKAKSGIKAVGKKVVSTAGKVAGEFSAAKEKQKAKAMSRPDTSSKSEPPKAASTDTSKSGTTGGSAAAKSDSSSSSSDSGSSSGESSSGGEKKKGFLRRLGGAMKRGLKKAAGKTLRGISTVTDKGAKKMGEETALKVRVKSESYDWRTGFFENLSDNLDPEDEEKINLKKGIKNKVTINPQMEETKADLGKRIEEVKLKAEINQIESKVVIDPLKEAVDKAVASRLKELMPQKEESDISASFNHRVAQLKGINEGEHDRRAAVDVVKAQIRAKYSKDSVE
tara:strand:+ start:444 stop:2267 length:1824 start_codon:yes stop_codon:yes gene_type:complete